MGVLPFTTLLGERAHHATPHTPAPRKISPREAMNGSRSVRALIRGAADGGMSLDHLYGAGGLDGKPVAAVFMVPQAGGTGLIFASRPRNPAESAALTEAVVACCSRAPQDRVKLAQALLAPGEEAQAAALSRAGFSRLAVLAYMEARLPRPSPPPPVPTGVRFHTWDPTLIEDFVAAMDASYIQTLDCPGLQGLRETRQVLAGHRATGVFDPRLWTLVSIGERPAGVALLNRVPSAACVELVYLGLAREHRGRGLGSTLVRHAFHLCADLGESTVTLAVDTANIPAVNLYRRFGFHRTATKTVMVRPL